MKLSPSMANVLRRGSTTQGRLAAVAVKEMMALQQEAKLLNPNGNQPKWSQIFRAHWTDYVTLAIVLMLFFIMEDMQPFRRVVYATSDHEYWRYTYPLKPNTVPAIAVPALAAGGPLVIFIVFYFAFRSSRLEFHNLVVGLLTNVFVTAAVTNFIKLSVGRNRPDFAARCWPSGIPTEQLVDSNGFLECTGDLRSIAEGMKSFPSGHTAWSASGLGFLAFWLLGKSKAFDGSGHPTRLVVGGLPLLVALWIGLTRIQDYWHHWEDVVCGYILGVTIAYGFYRTLYPPLTSSRSDVPSSLYHNRPVQELRRRDAPETGESTPLLSANV